MLELKKIEKRLADFVVKDINLAVKPDEYLVILGPTGTGKTVLLELIAGLLQADKGSIYFAGEEISDYQPENRKVGMVYQDYMLFPHLNVRENIAFGLKVQALEQAEIKSKVDEIVELFSIEDLLKRDVTTLSGGEQQRVALARALITSPEILLLDEPLSALDPATREDFQDELKRIHQKLKTTTLHVTHDFEEAVDLADRIAVMKDGRIVQVGTPAEIFQQPASHFVAEFIGTKNIFSAEKKAAADNYLQIEAEAGELKLAVEEDCEGEFKLSIRSEDIILSRDEPNLEADNSFRGKIVEIKDRIAYLELIIDIGIEISVELTRQVFRDLELAEADQLYLSFPASAVTIY